MNTKKAPKRYPDYKIFPDSDTRKHVLSFREARVGTYDTRQQARNAREQHDASRERVSGEKFYRWTVQIEVDAVWVADGFDLTDERMHGMLAKHLGYANHDELRAKVIKAPDPKEIRREQGARE